jgi:hypothetical protein
MNIRIFCACALKVKTQMFGLAAPLSGEAYLTPPYLWRNGIPKRSCLKDSQSTTDYLGDYVVIRKMIGRNLLLDN